MKCSKYISRWKSGFTDFVKEIFKRMSAVYNLRKKGTVLILGENELLAEMVRSYPCFYKKKKKKIWKEYKERKKNSLKSKKEIIVQYCGR